MIVSKVSRWEQWLDDRHVVSCCVLPSPPRLGGAVAYNFTWGSCLARPKGRRAPSLQYGATAIKGGSRSSAITAQRSGLNNTACLWTPWSTWCKT